MYEDLFSGVGRAPVEAIDAVFEIDSHDPVVLGNVPFYSVCEHHLLPFFGLAHLAYIPNGKIAGVSKLARALEMASRRLQVQERLTGQVADAIFDALDPDGVAVGSGSRASLYVHAWRKKTGKPGGDLGCPRPIRKLGGGPRRAA